MTRKNKPPKAARVARSSKFTNHLSQLGVCPTAKVDLHNQRPDQTRPDKSEMFNWHRHRHVAAKIETKANNY